MVMTLKTLERTALALTAASAATLVASLHRGATAEERANKKSHERARRDLAGKASSTSDDGFFSSSAAWLAGFASVVSDTAKSTAEHVANTAGDVVDRVSDATSHAYVGHSHVGHTTSAPSSGTTSSSTTLDPSSSSDSGGW